MFFPEPVSIVLLLVTGIAVGFGQGLLGVGGSFIMVPVMVGIFTGMDLSTDLAVKLAFGTALAVAFTTAIGSSLAHHRRGMVWWKAAVALGVAGAAGALLGSTVTSRYIHGDTLKVVFGAVVILSVIRLITARPPLAKGEPRDSVPLWAACGFPLGFVSGLIGIGGGILVIPLLTAILKFRVHLSVGTSTGVILFTSSAGALGYVVNGLDVGGLPDYSIGYLHLPSWVCLAATSVAMTEFGARVAHRLNARVLMTVFIILMLYLGLRMIGVFDWLGWPI